MLQHSWQCEAQQARWVTVNHSSERSIAAGLTGACKRLLLVFSRCRQLSYKALLEDAQKHVHMLCEMQLAAACLATHAAHMYPSDTAAAPEAARFRPAVGFRHATWVLLQLHWTFACCTHDATASR
jgi:hypothetical protein